VHVFRCYDNTAPNAKCQRVLALALCMVNNAGLIKERKLLTHFVQLEIDERLIDVFVLTRSPLACVRMH